MTLNDFRRERGEFFSPTTNLNSPTKVPQKAKVVVSSILIEIIFDSGGGTPYNQYSRETFFRSEVS